MPGVVAATDLTARGALAVDRALAIAAARQAKLTVLHVIDDDLPNNLVGLLRTESDEIVRQQVERARRLYGYQAGDVDVRVEVGNTYRRIVEALVETGADLLVVGTHRASPVRDVFLSSTVERILRLTGTPVLVARRPADHPLARALVAVDFSLPSRRAVECAAALFPAARFELVHAYDMPFATWVTSDTARAHYEDQFRVMVRAELDGFVAQLGLGDRLADRALLAGPPSQTILREAERRQSDLIVLGTHGRSGVGRAVLGSVAQEVLAAAACDVLAVKGW